MGRTKNGMAANTKMLHIKPTEKQPYMLDDFYFAISKDGKVKGLELICTDPVKETWEYKDVVDGSKYKEEDITFIGPVLKPKTDKEMRDLDGITIRLILKEVRLPSLYTAKVLRDLKQFDACSNPSGDGPRLGHRANMKQVVSFVKDLQRGYDNQLKKENDLKR